jgi:hypothetical protein
MCLSASHSSDTSYSNLLYYAFPAEHKRTCTHTQKMMHAAHEPLVTGTEPIILLSAPQQA